MARERGAGTKHHFHFSKTFTFSHFVSNPQGSTSPRYTKYDLDQALNRNPRTTWLCLWVGYHCAGACAPSKPKLASNQPSAASATLSNTFYFAFLLFHFLCYNFTCLQFYIFDSHINDSTQHLYTDQCSWPDCRKVIHIHTKG